MPLGVGLALSVKSRAARGCWLHDWLRQTWLAAVSLQKAELAQAGLRATSQQPQQNVARVPGLVCIG